MRGSTLQANRNDLWNGNIGMMQTSLVIHDANQNEVRENLGMAYKYDQLNRLIDARGYTDFNAGNNSWGTTASTGEYNNFFSYDANGNILTQKRWNRSTLLDDLTYNYSTEGGFINQNRLYSVDDAAVATTNNSSDMEDMLPFVNGVAVNGSNNYIYSKIGELVSDAQEEIAEIVWRVDSKIKEVIRTTGSDKQNLKFDYDAMGNRVAKHVMDDAGLCVHSTYYVRDASGNVMAVYERDSGCEEGLASYALTERHIYGSSRVGMNTTHVEYLNTQNTIETDRSSRTLGQKQYEISNHLGNVLTVVSDMKRVMDTNTDGVVDGYMAAIISVSDYSPFGVTLEGRSWSNDEYRFGFNGKDKESEFNSGAYDFGARIHDARLGRWMSVDPLVADNTYLSPYNSYDNSPIALNDPDGKNAKITVDENSKTITFSIQLTLIGDDATQAKATEIQAAVLQYWKATGFSYTDESGKKYDVNFECEVITGDQAIANIGMVEPYGNLVRLDASEDRSYVEGGWYGHWNPNAEACVFAHEVGHMLGLADAYVEYMYTDAGCMNCTDEERKEHYFTNWTSVQDENEIMGVAGGSSNNKPQVSQRDINALAGYALEHAPVLDGTTYITGNADLNGPTSADKLEYSGTGFVVEVAPNERVGQ